MRWLLGLIVVLLIAVGCAYYIAGRGAPPGIAIDKPERVVGQTGTLDVRAETPNGRFTAIAIALEQNGARIPLVDLQASSRGEIAPGAPAPVTVQQTDPNHLHITRPLGKQSIPQLQSGAARIVVTVTRPSFLKLRQLTSTATKDFQVRLEPPRIAVLSSKHYVNHGGSEMVVYKATPADVASGVRVGDVEYPGFPASGAGVAADPSVKVAFFALLYDQPLNTPIVASARDEAGNQARATFVD